MCTPLNPAALPRQLAYHLEDPGLREEERDEQEAEYGKLGWHAIDVTVVPRKAEDPEASNRWQPFTLSLLPIDRKPTQHSMVEVVSGQETPHEEDSTEGYTLHELRVHYGKEFVEFRQLPEGYDMAGPQRLRFIVGVPREQAVLHFAYHGVTFGRVELHVTGGRGLLE